MSPAIALLVCGGLSGIARERNGDYLDIYRTFLQATSPAQNNDPQFTFDPYFITREPFMFPNEDKYDCIMLTGSAASAYEDIEWINNLVAYIAHIAQTKPHIKIIGICFGHQIIARALGGECVPNGGRWELGPTRLRLTDLGKRIFNSDELTIQQMHRDHVPSVPPTFHLLGSTDISPNQGMVRFAPPSPSSNSTNDILPPDSSNATCTNAVLQPAQPLPPIQILTVQGHPEFTCPIVSSIIEQRVASGAIATPAAEDARRRLEEAEAQKTPRSDDALGLVGRVVWGVILGEM